MANEVVINSSKSAQLVIGSSSTKTVELGEHLEVITTDMPVYDGEYEVTPTVDPQSLATARHSMAHDVTVEGIPYFLTSNDGGGYTAIIG